MERLVSGATQAPVIVSPQDMERAVVPVPVPPDQMTVELSLQGYEDRVPLTWGQLIKNLPGQIAGSFETATSGLKRSMEESMLGGPRTLEGALTEALIREKPLTGLQTVEQIEAQETAAVEKGSLEAAAQKEAVRAKLPGQPTGTQSFALGVADSIVRSVVGVAPGVLLRQPGLALAGGTAAAGIPTYGEAYETKRAAGLEPEFARASAGVDAIAEASLGVLPLTKALDAGAPLKQRMIQTLYAELPTELATTVVQDMNAKMSHNPEMTMQDFAVDLASTVAGVLVQTPIQVGAFRGLEFARDRGQEAFYNYRARQLINSGVYEQDPRLSFAVRQGDLKEGGAHFALEGNSQYFPDQTGEIEAKGLGKLAHFDLSEARIFDGSSVETVKPLLFKVLGSKEFDADQKRTARDLLDNFEPGTPVDFRDIEAVNLSKAAKIAGFDGIQFFEDVDYGQPRTVNIWNLNKVKKLSKEDFEIRRYEFENALDIGGDYTYLPEAFRRIQELHAQSAAMLIPTEEDRKLVRPIVPFIDPNLEAQLQLPMPSTVQGTQAAMSTLSTGAVGNYLQLEGQPSRVLGKVETAPFTSTMPSLYDGSISVVGEFPTISGEILNQQDQKNLNQEVESLAQYFQQKLLRFTDQAPSVVVSYSDAGQGAGSFLPSAEGTIFINLRPLAIADKLKGLDASAKAKAFRTHVIGTVHHEFGHAYLDQMFRIAPVETVQKLRADYMKWLNRITQPGYSVKDYIKEGAGIDYARRIVETAGSGEWLEKPFVEFYGKLLATPGMTGREADYLVEFHEYAARQMEKWVLSNKDDKKKQSAFWRQTASELLETAKELKVDAKPSEIFHSFANYNRTLNALRDFAADFKKNPPLIRSMPADQGGRIVKSLTGKQIHLEKELTKRIEEGIDKYSTLVRHGATLTQLAKLNLHLAPLQLYTQGVRDWHTTTTAWMTRANDRLIQWERLGKDQSDRLGKFLYDWTLLGKRPDATGLSELAQKHSLSPEALEVFTAIDSDFNQMLREMEVTLKADAVQTIKDPAAQEAAIKAIEADFAVLYAKPYFPLKRFGRYTIQLKANQKVALEGKNYRPGAIIRFETYETQAERDSAYQELLRRYPADGVSMSLSKGLVEENFQYFAGMPPSLVKNLASKLRLSEEQSKTLQHLVHDLAPAQSFVKHFNRRKETAGYSEDAIRTYASYFFQASRHLARVKHYNTLQEAIKGLQHSAINLDQMHAADSTKRHQIHEHVQRHYEYIMNPQDEWAALRGFGFLWHLGFNVKSAVVNLTQVPMVAYPYLAARYGDGKASVTLGKAIRDAGRYWRNPDALSEEEQLAFAEMRKAGFIDESQATELAGVAEGGRLARALPATKTGYMVRSLGFYGAWMFQQAEKYNRRVTALATYRLGREAGMTPEQAFASARDAVETAMFEYASWNRPQFMRGKKSVIFLFYQYIQNMTYFMFGGDPGAWRVWAMMMLFAGLQGLPFIENALDLANGIWQRVPGKKAHTNLEDYARAYVNELGLTPDLIMHGIGRNSFGIGALMEAMNYDFPMLDISSSLSMSRPVPGTEALGSIIGGVTEYDKALASVTEDTAGAFVAIPLSILKAVTDDNPDQFKRWERVLPSALKGAKRAVDGMTGGIKDASGFPLKRYDPYDPVDIAETAFMALGFQSTEVSREWERRAAVFEVTTHWLTRRQILIQNYFYAWQMKDREAKAEVLQSIRSFNKEVPYPEMKLGFDTLSRSVLQRNKNQELKERGLPPQQMLRRVSQDVSELYPGGTE